MRMTFAWVLAFPGAISAADLSGNSYCLSGANWARNGVLERMHLPGKQGSLHGSIGYIWDTLQSTNIPNMVRPKRYWELTGQHKILFHGYDRLKDEILEPDKFDQWVRQNPGKIWIIGNEVNHHLQDGLTHDEYARMFHTYHDFIKVQGRDSRARFAGGSCLAIAEGTWLQNNIDYWNQALASYRKQFGQDMPIDIWNNHLYAPAGELDPDRLIHSYFKPFREYVDTVSGGIYADKPIWCTEFGVSMWATPLHPDYVAEFVQQLCPRLEQAYELTTGTKKRVLDRWFWFIAQQEKSAFWDSAMLLPNNTLTQAGVAYVRLAGRTRMKPNPVPSSPPFPEPATDAAQYDFSRGLKPFRPWAGDWSVVKGVCKHTVSEHRAGRGMHLHLPQWYKDFAIAADIRIEQGDGKAGFFLRHGTVWKDGQQGYSAMINSHGDVILGSKKHGDIQKAEKAVEEVSVFHRLGATFRGHHIEVTLDGKTIITWNDPDNFRAEGLVSLSAGMCDAGFDNVEVTPMKHADAAVKK